MTLEEYKTELKKRLDAAHFMHIRDKDGAAYRLLAEASRDRSLRTEEWAELANLFYGYRRM